MSAKARAAAERRRVLHELKTPLTVVSGRLQLWRRRSQRTGQDVAPTAAELDGLLEVLDRLAGTVEAVEAGGHERDEQYRTIVEQATDYAIFTTDAEGRIDAWPPGAEAVFGWTEAEAVGMPFQETYTPEDRAAGVPEQELAAARDLGGAPNVRWHARKGGGRVFIEGVARGRFAADGAFLGVLKVGQDTTERRDGEERARAELEARVAEATAEQRALSRRLLLVQEEERRRLALELHDEVGQTLTGLGLQLGAGAATDAERLADARATVTELTDQVRQLSMELRPAALDRYGLLPALRWLSERYGARTGIRVDLFEEGLDGRFAPEIEIVAYRIVQEALTNVARHSGAAAASVHLLAEDGAMTVVVRDRGQGFAKGRVAPGSGLGGMRERADLLGGTLEVDAAPGEGVTVTAELPVHGANKPDR